MKQTYAHPLSNEIPDPKDRTPNDPAILVPSKNVREYLKANDIR